MTSNEVAPPPHGEVANRITKQRLQELYGYPYAKQMSELLPPEGATLLQALGLDIPERDRLWLVRVANLLIPIHRWEWQARFVTRALNRVGNSDPRLVSVATLLSKMACGEEITRDVLDDAKSTAWRAAMEAVRLSQWSVLKPPSIRYANLVAVSAALATARSADSMVRYDELARHEFESSSLEVLHQASLSSRYAVSSAANLDARGYTSWDLTIIEERQQISDLIEILSRPPGSPSDLTGLDHNHLDKGTEPS